MGRFLRVRSGLSIPYANEPHAEETRLVGKQDLKLSLGEDRRSNVCQNLFAGWRALDMKVPDLRAYITRRQDEGASNAEINRELSVLRRGFTLACQAEILTHMPHFLRLEESAPRAGFFEADEFAAVLQHLPACLQAPLTFTYLTGWRCRLEILRLQWRNIDFEAGTIWLDVGSTKNKDRRII